MQSHHLSAGSLLLPRQTCNEALADLTNSSLIENSAHRQFHIFPGQGQSCSLLLSSSQPAFIWEMLWGDSWMHFHSLLLKFAEILSDFYKYCWIGGWQYFSKLLETPEHQYLV